MIAVQMGSELGLAPMQAIQNIAVINGRPSVWGDAMLALVKASPVCDDVIETFEGEGDSLVAICVAKRKGKAPVESRFSVDDAKAAGLWGKSGPWQQYRRRMLQMRARGFALRDAFPDVLKGLISAEEAADTPVDAFRESVTQPQRLTPEPRTIEHTEPRPVDHVAMIEARARQCRTVQDAITLNGIWEQTLEKANAAGKAISAEVAHRVAEVIAARQDELADEAGRVNQKVEEEIPA